MQNKSTVSRIIQRAKTPSAGEIMAAANRGDEKIGGAEVLEKPELIRKGRFTMSPQLASIKASRHVQMRSPEEFHRAGHDKFNEFVNIASNDDEIRGGASPDSPAGQGIENARAFVMHAQNSLSKHKEARQLFGNDEAFRQFAPHLHAMGKGLAQSRVAAEGGAPVGPAAGVQAFHDMVKAAAKPGEQPRETFQRVNAAASKLAESEKHKSICHNYMKKVGIPQEHHHEIFASAATWKPDTGVEKSMKKSILSKLRKALPSAKEETQDAGESSPSLERVSVAPEESKTSPFKESKEAAEKIKKCHKWLKERIEKERMDGDADATAVYSMNEANVEKPLEKASPSYKTLRSVKLPNGHRVNVYGNNGYERISNGPHRGRYLHSILAELKMGRKLKANEEIDHKNGNRTDNNVNNMQVRTTSEHASHTNHERAKQGGFTGEKRYMHSREYTEGKPQAMDKSGGLAMRPTGSMAESVPEAPSAPIIPPPVAALGKAEGSIRSILNKCKTR